MVVVNCTLNIVTGKLNESYLLDSREVLGHFDIHSKLTGRNISLTDVLLVYLNWKSHTTEPQKRDVRPVPPEIKKKELS